MCTVQIMNCVISQVRMQQAPCSQLGSHNIYTGLIKTYVHTLFAFKLSGKIRRKKQKSARVHRHTRTLLQRD